LAAADPVNRARLGPAGRRTQQASETAAARRSGTTRRGPLPAGYLQVAGPTGVPCGAQTTRRDEEKHHSIRHPRRATPRLATRVWSPRILCSASGASAHCRPIGTAAYHRMSRGRILSAIDGMKCGLSQTWVSIPNVNRRKPRLNCSCGLWRNLLPHVFTALASVHRPDPTLANGAVYQFGVFQGMSMRMMRHMEPFANAPMIGFDSFEGLPSSLSRSERSEWSPGQFAADREQSYKIR